MKFSEWKGGPGPLGWILGMAVLTGAAWAGDPAAPPAPSDGPELVAFASGDGGLCLRLEGGPAFGVGRLLLWEGAGPGGARAAQMIRLGSDGSWSERWPAAAARAVGGWSARAEVRGGPPMASTWGVQVTATIGLPPAGSAPPSVWQRGDVLINEFMKDPAFVSDSKGEWIELYNATDHVVNIEGWVLRDRGSNYHLIVNGGQRIELTPGEHFVLGINDDPLLNGGVVVDYRYSSFTLSNGADEVLLYNRGGLLIDQIEYDDGVQWPDSAGRSISLSAAAQNAAANDLGANWCHSSVALGGSNPDQGTPGLPNDPCR